MSFRKGDKVIQELHGAGYITEEVKTVAYIKNKQVYLDNGPGNDPTGPFDQDGFYLDSMFGFSMRIRHTN